MLPKAENNISIATEAIVACPALDFRPRRACVACPQCEHFRGLAIMGSSGTWSQQFAIRCAHIIERRTTILDVVEE